MVKNHKQDSFDGGRAASIAREHDPVSTDELTRKARPGTNLHPDDDDVYALLIAASTLASADE
jgi:hypothetical protein